MVAYPRAILLLELLLLPTFGQASVLGLIPTELPVNHPTQELSVDTALDALEEVEQRIHESNEVSVQLLFEAALLAAATRRPEDRLYAIEKLELGRRHAPERFDLVLWEAELRARAREYRAGASLLNACEDDFSDLPEFYLARGILHWLDSRRHLAPEAQERAARDFGQAHRLRPGHLPFSRAVAAVSLVRNRPEAGLRALPSVEVGASVDLATLLLQGALLGTQSQQEEQAEQLMWQAVQALPAPLRGVFLDGGGLLPGVEAGDARSATRFWWERNPHPTRISNSRRMLFWRRLVEADILFGDRESGTPGWQTTTGEAWVRWGRPTWRHFRPPDEIGFESARSTNTRGFRVEDPVALSVPPPSSGPQDDVRAYTGGSRIDASGTISRWMWGYSYGDQSFLLVFNDVTHNDRWRLQGPSAALHAVMVRDRSLILPSLTVPHGFELAVAVTGRMPYAERSAIDAAIAVLPRLDGAVEDEPENVAVDWALFDSGGARMDRGHLLMGAERSRKALMDRLAADTITLDIRPARVARVGLSLQPGDYVLAVEATDTTTGAHEWSRNVVRLARRPKDHPVLSDLVLSSTFTPLESASDLAPEFVRYAHVIVPMAERRLTTSQESVFVYFEVYDLGLDSTGSTRLRVDYLIEAAGGPTPAGGERFRRQSFVEESTGQTPEGVVVKGTRLDLEGFEPGFYELSVIVHDQVLDLEASRSLGFEIVDEQDLEG